MKRKSVISQRQSKFLNEFLRTKPLADLLPLYVAAISENTELFKTLPEGLITPVLESLKNFQEMAGSPKECEKTNFSLDAILRNLRDLDGRELLSSYVFSVTKDSTAYSQISEDKRISAEGWLDELRACVTGKRGLFSNEFDPETFIDEFIEFAGGARLTKILGASPQTDNADYFFQQDSVIMELKILKTDFWESNAEKLEAVRNEFLRKNKITAGMILGTDKSYPWELFFAQFKVLRDALQKITKKANKQIKSSKSLLNAPDARGVAMFLIDGFYSVSPFVIIESLHEPITRQFSAVDAIIIISFRRKVTLDLGDGLFDYFIFEPRYKPNRPEWLSDFINQLGLQWFDYMQLLSGKRFSKQIFSHDSRNLAGAAWK